MPLFKTCLVCIGGMSIARCLLASACIAYVRSHVGLPPTATGISMKHLCWESHKNDNYLILEEKNVLYIQHFYGIMGFIQSFNLLKWFIGFDDILLENVSVHSVPYSEMVDHVFRSMLKEQIIYVHGNFVFGNNWSLYYSRIVDCDIMSVHTRKY